MGIPPPPSCGLLHEDPVFFGVRTFFPAVNRRRGRPFAPPQADVVTSLSLFPAAFSPSSWNWPPGTVQILNKCSLLRACGLFPSPSPTCYLAPYRPPFRPFTPYAAPGTTSTPPFDISPQRPPRTGPVPSFWIPGELYASWMSYPRDTIPPLSHIFLLLGLSRRVTYRSHFTWCLHHVISSGAADLRC